MHLKHASMHRIMGRLVAARHIESERAQIQPDSREEGETDDNLRALRVPKEDDDAGRKKTNVNTQYGG